MKKWFLKFVPLCLLLFILTACGAEQDVSAGEAQPVGEASAPADTNPEEPAQEAPAEAVQAVSYPIPQENRRSATPYDYCPSTTANGYYTVYNKILFHDVETGTAVVWCAQPGCTHTDETCQAWLGQVISYTEYQGRFLATVQDGEGGVQLLEKDLSTGVNTVLETWTGSETESYSVTLGRAADGLLVINSKRYISESEGETFSVTEKESMWLYNLETGELQALFSESEAAMMDVMAISGRSALVMYTPEDAEEGLLTEDEFHAQYGSGYETSYGRYEKWERKHELRLYDLATMEYTMIASTERDQLRPYTDSNHTYGKQTIYLCGDTLYIIDLETGESSELLTMEGLINWWLMDGKAFFIVHDGVKDGASVYTSYDSLSIYWADLENPVPVQLNNGGVADVMTFSINYEGNGFFIGNYNSLAHVISKADFYAEQYENTPLA